jgi:hypothetical protein
MQLQEGCAHFSVLLSAMKIASIEPSARGVPIATPADFPTC